MMLDFWPGLQAPQAIPGQAEKNWPVGSSGRDLWNIQIGEENSFGEVLICVKKFD